MKYRLTFEQQRKIYMAIAFDYDDLERQVEDNISE